METPVISVVVPAYNCGPELRRCIDSILNQTCKNLEIIVVDDGSRDNTQEVLRSYGDRIRWISQKNAGVTAARLQGVRLAGGQWIGFVDGDDCIENTMYERLLENALKHGADISQCGSREIYPDGRVVRNHNRGYLKEQDHLEALQDLLENVFIEPSLCEKLYKRSLFEGLSEKMDCSIRNNEDMLMNYYLFRKAESAVYEDVDPYHYRIREKSASRGNLSEHAVFDPIKVRKIILKDCPPALLPAARESLVWTTLFSYRCLVWSGEDRQTDLGKLRRELQGQKQYRKDLKRKTALQLDLIGRAPRLYDRLLKLAGKRMGGKV